MAVGARVRPQRELPKESYPGEENWAVVFEHLRLGCDLSRRMRGPGTADHRIYG